MGNDFAFLLGEWDVKNEIRTADGGWRETDATLTVEEHLGGALVIDRWEGVARAGVPLRGVTIRSFNSETGQWSLIWLDDRHPADLRPLVGGFEDGVGLFFQDIEMDGVTTRVRFTWDEITDESARWTQAFSTDGGTNWDDDWIMYFKRRR